MVAYSGGSTGIHRLEGGSVGLGARRLDRFLSRFVDSSTVARAIGLDRAPMEFQVMNRKHMMIGGIASIATLLGTASAEFLIEIDLSIEDEITMTALAGASAETVSFSNFTGVYLVDFYGGTGDSLTATLVSGDLTTFGDPTDDSPSLFRGGGGSDPGLNLWSFSSLGTVGVTAGQQAFEGSATWTLSSSMYADMLAGSTSGNILADADTADDPGTLIGEYTVVPAPGALALLGIVGFAARRRR